MARGEEENMKKPHAARKCGAKTRDGDSCKNWGMKNGRCRMHGGKSSGRPPIHGRYTKEAIENRRENRKLVKAIMQALAALRNASEP